MKYKLEIDIDNDAFVNNPDFEISRLLQKEGKRIIS